MGNKRRVIRLATALGATLLLSGCVLSRMESYSEPGTRLQRFARIAVDYRSDDMIHKRRAERAFAAALSREARGTELLPAPPRQRGADLDELQRLGFDGYLRIDLRERVIDPRGEAPLLLIDEPLPLAFGDMCEFLAFNLDLVDVRSGERVWTATCHLTRNQLASFNRVVRALARRTASDLRRTGYTF